ncbi:hypothetical protein BKA70DRAFT_1108941 [Coprinopsis sp. MPI-PUGE-AT-0042]|nr:hypothetical protein BKA70DRAFT_1108941 [Coprinopsis sp. MPI-PUGE-AT-0042]
MARATSSLLIPAFFFFSLLNAVFAANDWSKACLDGVCYYDLPSTSGQPSSGSLKIWGSSDAITDITAAAGWEILDCQKDALSQDIRLVCTGNDDSCAHLYKTIGAEGKVVRLPENCGSNAFAHISRAWVPENQSIPDNVAKKLVRRDGTQPEVKALHIDTDFAAVDAKKTGPVNFALTGSNVPGAKDISPFPSSKTTPTPKNNKRFLGGLIDKAKEKVNKAVDSVKSTANEAVNAVKDTTKKADLNEVALDQTQTLPPFNVNKNFNLIDQTLSCPPIEARLKIDVDAKANAVATIGVVAEGTLIPPRVTDFVLTTTMTGEIDGTLKMIAGISGSLDSGEIKLVEVGIPGLDFPGILTVGPTFAVSAQANANLDLSANVDVGINYKIEKATLVFPPKAGKAQAQGGAFNLGNTPLKLSVAPTVKATGRVEAHLIPSLNLAITALGGVADARVFLNLDASAAMQLSVEAGAQASLTVDRAQPKTRDLAIRGAGPMGGNYFASRQLSTQTAASTSFGGCFEILAGLDVNAGANAEFFGLFDASTKVPLFTKEFELFKKCFGDKANAARRRSLGRFAYIAARSPVVSQLERRILSCPAADATATSAPESVVDEVVPAAQ